MIQKEVSCKALGPLFQGLQRNHIPLEILCKGIPYSLQHLKNKDQRIEWDVYCAIISNVSALWADEDFVQLGYEFVRSKSFGAITSIIRLTFGARELYRWFNRAETGAYRQIFSNLIVKHEDIDKNHLRVTIQIPPACRDCREFFLLTKGGFSSSTTLVGLPPARVQMRTMERGAIYDIHIPEGGGVSSWARKRVTWMIGARAAARELRDANEALHERYAQLEEAQAKIQRQAMQLQTAFGITVLIRSNLDLDSTMRAVARSFVELAHFAAVRVVVSLNTHIGGLSRVAMEGIPTSDEHTRTTVLEARGQCLGELTVWLRPDADPLEAQELLDQVVASVAMEINDALSFTLLTKYRDREKLLQQEFSRQQIESQEAERKRLAGELHDGLGQDLLVAGNELQQFLREENPSKENLAQAASLVQESIETVREISSNLHPHHLDRLGFGAAVEAMAENLSRTSALSIECTMDNIDATLSKETEIHLYRIIQEALTNVVRHARAKNVQVLVKKNLGAVDLTVTDDGIGFDTAEGPGGLRVPTSGERFHGFGLSSISERARIIGGTIRVQSSPGNGTSVHVTFPYSQ